MEAYRPLYIDLECDNLLHDVTTIWCAVCYDPERKKYLIYHDDQWYNKVTHPPNTIYYPDISILLHDFKEYTLVAHNLMGFDRLVLEKLHNYTHPIDRCIDTLVLSSVQYPDREAHSVGYYGELFKFEKGDHNDWSKFSNEMLQYCQRDVDLLVRIHDYLVREQDGWDWSLALKIEHATADLMARQEDYGVLFDVPKAEELVAKIEEEIKEIEVAALEEIPKRAVPYGTEIKKPFLKSGELSKQVLEWINNDR